VFAVQVMHSCMELARLTSLTPAQQLGIPAMLRGHDTVLYETSGMGKTVRFIGCFAAKRMRSRFTSRFHA